jgi:hypothetical protein
MIRTPRLLPHFFACLFFVASTGGRLARAQEEATRPNTAEAAQGREKDREKDFEKGEDGSFMRKRMDWFYHQRAYPHKHIPSGARLRALHQLDVRLAAEAAAKSRGRGDRAIAPQQTGPSWTAIGPQPVDSFGLVSSGRVTAVAVDPTNNNVVYAGAADGGIWKTTDGGNTWTPLTDQQASLATGSIAIDPENHLTIYVGTGEENNAVDSYYGAGILKSTDGGNTWTQIPGPFVGGSGGGSRIGGLAVHPTNSNIVLAAVGYGGPQNWGVFRSADGGNTWTNVFSNGDQAYNVIFNPTNGNIAYASLDTDGVIMSSDGGQTWSAANGTGTNVLPTGGNTERVALAMDPNNPSTLYAGIAITPFGNSGQLYGLYKTTDGGTNWIQLTSTPNYCGGQCWYDNVIAVAPGNSNAVFAGGSGWGNQLYQSLDGGNTWALTEPGDNSTIHPDLHALAFTADGSILYLGNDGGMYSTTQIGVALTTVTPLNAGTSPGTGLGTLQFYPGPAIHPTNTNIGFGGTQDNGSMMYSGSLSWNGGGGCGDGARNLIDSANPNNVYESCVELSVWKSTDGGSADSFNQVQNGLDPDGTDSVNWVAPFTLDPSNTQNLYFGTNFVYQTTNGAGLWTAISPDFTGGTGNLNALAVSPVSSNTVYAGANGSNGPLVYVSTNALSGSGATWSNITDSFFPNRYLNVIAADPHSSTAAYVGLSGWTGFGDSLGHIFMTTNGGSSWSDISGDLPNVPVNDIVVDPDIANTIFVATDVGVFYTTNLGISWGTMVTSLPRAVVTGLAYQHQTQTLWAGTHGRSMWSASVASLVPVPGVTSISPTSATVGASAFTLTVNGTAFNSSSVVQWNGADLTTTFVSATQVTAQVPASDLLTAGTIPVTVVNPGSSVSNSATFTIDNPVPAAGSLSPSSAGVGGPAFTLTVNGTNFVNGATVLWNNSARTTAFVSSIQVTATINASDIATAGTDQVSVSNPSPGGGTSGTLPFTVGNPVPSLTSVSPTSKTVGSASFTLTVKGSNLVKGASANWNGSALATTFKSGTELTATVPAANLTKAGTFPITATNPGPGGGVSGSLTFTVDNAKPTISSLSPSSTIAGGSGFTLTVNGTKFVSNSVVNWAGSPRTTTFVSATKVTAVINAADIVKAGTFKVTVTNPAPGGGTSASSNFTVDNPAPTLASIAPNSATHGGASFTLTATGTNYVSSSVIEWNAKKLTTTYVSSTTLTATVPSSDIKTAGTASVTVVTPTPGGGTSNAKTFTIN